MNFDNSQHCSQFPKIVFFSPRKPGFVTICALGDEHCVESAIFSKVFQIFTWSSLMTVQIKGITFSTKDTQIYHLKGTASKLLQTSSLFKVNKIYSQFGDIAQTWPGGHLRKDILGTKLYFGIFYLCPSSQDLWFSEVRIMILDTVPSLQPLLKISRKKVI